MMSDNLPRGKVPNPAVKPIDEVAITLFGFAGQRFYFNFLNECLKLEV